MHGTRLEIDVGFPGRDAADRSAGERERLAEAVATARWLYAMRGRRTRSLGAKVFAEPGWDLLLDLFISRASGRTLSVTAACIGSRVSAGTALRYVSLLCEAGIVERSADESDHRRSFLRLTDRGYDRMIDLLSSQGAPPRT